ncbi:MAG: PAS domain S-box protein [Deltaproteobacteria bacterium]|nr:MAG: PAS domain S-box protein [Deltaproteobacteria bacterium]
MESAPAAGELRALELEDTHFRLAIEAAPTGMLMIDEAGTILLVNAQIERLFGYTRAELVGGHIDMLIPDSSRASHPEFRERYFADPQTRPMGAGRELFARRKDGREVPVEIGLNPMTTESGRYVLSSVVDITERKRAEREREALLRQLRGLNADLEVRVAARTAELSGALAERDILIREIHHRVKNNLQVISSLIRMQMRSLADQGARAALDECQSRVSAIALIHEKLYQSDDYALVPFSGYAESLAMGVVHLSASGHAVTLRIDVDEVLLPMDRAIPCGLILNELIVNAMRHAFPDGRSGELAVELRRVDAARARLTVSDDGVGLPESFRVADAASLGLQLVTALVEQLDAALEVATGPGATFSILFATGA